MVRGGLALNQQFPRRHRHLGLHLHITIQDLKKVVTVMTVNDWRISHQGNLQA
ncbi:MAG: hypothetical protein KUG79_10115 [Pseudomonadales bacterium]|nr:hypothetical protein [Pseudomonadales bacterium]